jgi:hypothetical protein
MIGGRLVIPGRANQRAPELVWVRRVQPIIAAARVSQASASFRFDRGGGGDREGR